MKTISTPADIAALSETDKDIVFAFDNARASFKTGLIQSVITPLFLVAGSLFVIYFSDSEMLKAPEWMRLASDWIGYIGIGTGLLGVPIFSRNLKRDFQAMRITKQILVSRGLDASRMRSKDIWAGLFPPAKGGVKS